jgi:hypothetical protein
MKGKMLIEGELVGVSDGPVTIPIIPPPGGGEPTDPITPAPPPPPTVRRPYFDIGDGEGKPGEVVEIVVEAGCVHPINGFHIGGGVGLLPNVERSGYGLFRGVGVKLGPFLRGYLMEQDLLHDEPFHRHDHYWSGFQFIQARPSRPFPEEFWEYAIGFFSLDQQRAGIDPVAIPGGTELFTLQIEILDGTPEAQYTLTCEDEHYWTHGRVRRRDYLFTANAESPFASGGVTKIETFPGLLRVRA